MAAVRSSSPKDASLSHGRCHDGQDCATHTAPMASADEEKFSWDTTVKKDSRIWV
jgi:hypothetical protein